MNPLYLLFDEVYLKLIVLMLVMSASFIFGAYTLIVLMIKVWGHIIII
jgi:hypothetical protein